MTKELTSRLKKKKKGFTLIELIIVIAIIAIIAAIAIPNFAKVRNDSKKKADIQSCETIKRTALTKIADGSIPVTPTQENVNTLTITFDENNAPVFTSATAFQETLSTLKKPQEDGATGYSIKVNRAGEVEVDVTGTGITTKTDTIATP
ncbi:prepilin-type N-terminal cleavage/methylation domain-containing protein [Clostridium folliculivorans]|uniref:prepilin-type N-terminal cleavage/methylation domain-containing protein n=1 Tax=Clostridium folliculivorans TaxID=2886038 RepID=UPI0024751D99|nr:prepilin-type N-terminal cleavage/methylation domain-containing protein [Clostridium folliculivorans]GKU32023.1 hypothetical protein CFB3_41310 [Clostridium folliculivorans]